MEAVSKKKTKKYKPIFMGSEYQIALGHYPGDPQEISDRAVQWWKYQKKMKHASN